MAWRKSPPELVDLFNKVLPNDSRVERRQMFGYPCAFVNGNMFTGLHQEDFIVRLGEKERTAMQEKEGAGNFMPMPGRSMREYVAFPEHILNDEKAVKRWLKLSLSDAGKLPPKTRKARKSTPQKRSVK